MTKRSPQGSVESAEFEFPVAVGDKQHPFVDFIR